MAKAMDPTVKCTALKAIVPTGAFVVGTQMARIAVASALGDVLEQADIASAGLRILDSRSVQRNARNFDPMPPWMERHQAAPGRGLRSTRTPDERFRRAWSIDSEREASYA
jgi:hypothetical protein